MSIEPVLKIAAGEGMDALVAERVMGVSLTHEAHDWSKDWETEDSMHGGRECVNCGVQTYTCDPDYHKGHKIPAECKADPLPYSASLPFAWDVIQKLQSQGWKFLMGDDSSFIEKPGAWVSVRFFKSGLPGYTAHVGARAQARTAPEAICAAALFLVEKLKGSES